MPGVQVASAEPPAEVSAIGELTAGGEANPKSQQEAADMIAANEKRLNALPAQMTDDQKAQISKVKNFQRQAQEALNSGDGEGAKTLATKAKLLLDDVLK
jgi:ribosomal protein S20